MQNSHQELWEFYPGTTARKGQEKSVWVLQNTTMLHSCKCLPFWWKVPKNFRKRVCNDTGNRMTFLKSDHRTPKIRSQRKWTKFIRSSHTQIRKIYVAYFTVFCPGHFWVTPTHQLFWFPSGELAFNVMIFFPVFELILLLLVCTFSLLWDCYNLLGGHTYIYIDNHYILFNSNQGKKCKTKKSNWSDSAALLPQ